MLFKDYYAILEINNTASTEEIKSSFRRLAIKWHPDRNQETDTTLKMQELNEAYLILKDNEARERYDKEYEIYKQSIISEQPSKGSPISSETEPDKYEVHDEILKKWMTNAHSQAKDLAKRSLEDIKGMVISGAKEGSKAIVYQIIGVIIVIMLFGLTRNCDTKNEQPSSQVSHSKDTDIWFNNSIHWFNIQTPQKFIKQNINYEEGLPGYNEKINSIENYTFQSGELGGTFLYMDTQFASYLPEVGLKKSIENLLHTTSSYNLQLTCNDKQNNLEDVECTGTFNNANFKGYVKGYSVWIDKKVYSVAVLTMNSKENINLVDSIFNSISIIK